MRKTIIIVTVVITLAAVFFTIFNVFTREKTNDTENIDMSKIKSTESLNVSNESSIKDKREREMNVLSSILEKKSNINAAKISWDWLIENGFNSKESIKHLIELRKNGGGWIYYSELANIITSKTVSDEPSSLIFKILTDVYEGGDWQSGDFNLPQNEKDNIIQDVLRFEINNPSGKMTFFEALRNADILESGYNLYHMTSNAIDRNSNIITIENSYRIKLKYSRNMYEILTKNISNINKLSLEEQYKIRPSIYETVKYHIDSEEITYDKNLQLELKLFLDNNKVQIKQLTTALEDEHEFKSIDEFNKWNQSHKEENLKRQLQTHEYVAWVEAYGVSEGAQNINDYLYNHAVSTKSITEKLAIIQLQVEKASRESNSENLILYTKSPYLKSQLQASLNDQNINNDLKNEINYFLQNVFD